MRPEILPAVTREQFDAMSAAEKRVTIARDVLAQVDARRLRPKSGQYLSVARSSVRSTVEATVVNAPRCYACAIGGAFVAAVRLADDVHEENLAPVAAWMKGLSFDVTATGRALREHLARFFGYRQLALIEAAFECDPLMACEASELWDQDLCGDFVAAEAFGLQHSTDTARFVAVWGNVAANGGDFRP